MGVEPYLIASCLNAVLAQRLLRRVCKFCAKEGPPSPLAKALLEECGHADVKSVVSAVGCEECDGSGYSGRLAVHELFEINDEIRELLGSKAGSAEIEKAARRSGMRTLKEDGVEKLLAGLTSAEEVLRATQSD
jgi:type II secretory ATPase GspE/PulE/Tfp pilus assembly ATPase PilB-like protein